MLPGGADVGEALVTDPGVQLISFTGSTRGRAHRRRLAAEISKRVHLELGGNSALIVLDDVDVEKAVSVAAFGSFLHQGQVCMSTGRHLVQRRIADEYIEPAWPSTRTGCPSATPPPSRSRSARSSTASSAIKHPRPGHELGRRGRAARRRRQVRRPLLPRRPCSPTSRQGARVQEEIFGPVAPVVAFDTLDEAVELARDTEYGLSLGILSPRRDEGAGARRPHPERHRAHQRPDGHATRSSTRSAASGPSGGGGRLGGPLANFEAFTEVQWVTMRSDLPAYPF